jgi:hypothetical protein
VMFAMNTRQNEKKAWELEQGALVASELNKSGNFDYEAELADHEPADVNLQSASGEYGLRPAQIVSIPLDFRSRDDKQTVNRVAAALEELLIERGASHMLVGLVLSGEAEMHGVRQPLVQQLADLIMQNQTTNFRLQYDDLYQCSPELAEKFHDVLVFAKFPSDGFTLETIYRRNFEYFGN